ncbi:MAG: fasciclin domain-containing protein, partial [Acidobacteriaceae bacterium]|nr:fasciclin domain-containing protein [Acidobacteriaceae bacterium]
ECSKFLDLIRNADLESTLGVSGLRTLFAPTNDAIVNASPEEPEPLVNKHLAQGAIETFDLRRMEAVKNFAGDKLRVEVRGGTFRIGSANIVRSDIPCTNGVIHVVDALVS